MVIKQRKNQVPEEDSAVAESPNPKISADWRPTAAEPSPLWRKLWARLLTNKKEKPTDTRKDASEGKCEDGNERKVPDF